MNDHSYPHNDEPVIDVQNLLGRKQLLEEITQAIADCSPPQVFGIHGDWGSGKTSFLHALQLELTGECPQNAGAGTKDTPHHHVTAIWFEAWRYQSEQTPIVALLHEIRAQLTWKTHFWEKAKEEGSKLTEAGIRGVLMAFEDITKKIGIQASKIQESGEAWERNHLAVTLPSNQVRELLNEVIGKLLSPEAEIARPASQPSRRLVVFIDDLDRCEAETAFRLLEGIKIYLNISSCVFVLGLNQREIERAIAKVIPSTQKDNEAELLIRAQEYMEKLCGNIHHLPLPDSKRQAKIVEHFLTKMAEDKRAKDVCEAIVQLVGQAPCLPANPRRIKGFCNTVARLLLRRMKKIPAGDPIPSAEAPVVCVVASLYQFHSALYRLVESTLAESGAPAMRGGFFEFMKRCVTEDYWWQPRKENERADPMRSHPELDKLKLPILHRKPEPTAASETIPLYADPAYGNVLHCQKWIAENEILVSDLRSYIEIEDEGHATEAANH